MATVYIETSIVSYLRQRGVSEMVASDQIKRAVTDDATEGTVWVLTTGG